MYKYEVIFWLWSFKHEKELLVKKKTWGVETNR